MSLKAKLEAVIYAAEEPVTLAQLAALFTAEALEWKAEQEAAAAAAKEAEPAQAATSQAMLGEGLEYLGLEQTPAFYASEESAPEGTGPALESALEPALEAAAEAAEPSAEPDAEPETAAAEAKTNLDAETEA
ncbi:MAG: SMC-Scp complex subunit ScpB, partial [Terracidiphilus sp.]